MYSFFIMSNLKHISDEDTKFKCTLNIDLYFKYTYSRPLISIILCFTKRNLCVTNRHLIFYVISIIKAYRVLYITFKYLLFKLIFLKYVGDTFV